MELDFGWRIVSRWLEKCCVCACSPFLQATQFVNKLLNRPYVTLTRTVSLSPFILPRSLSPLSLSLSPSLSLSICLSLVLSLSLSLFPSSLSLSLSLYLPY